MHPIGLEQAMHFMERYGYALLFWWVLAEQGALPILRFRFSSLPVRWCGRAA